MKQISSLLLGLTLLLSIVVLTTDVSQMGFAQNGCLEDSARSSPNDIDGDGISNTIEVNGLDINEDGNPEINFTALGGNANHKDIYLKIDYMKNHKPSQEGLDMVIQTFASAPVCNPDGKNGIDLHIRVDNELPHLDKINIDCVTGDWSGFKDEESKILNLNKIRLGQNAPDTLMAENRFYYHAIFAHNQGKYISPLGWFEEGFSGCADPPNRNLVVSLGSFKKSLNVTATGDVRSNPEFEAGTLLHELGHTLGLHHGGIDDYAYKPNYISVMNYNLQFPDLVGNRALDYSRCEMLPLNESGLNESEGIGPTCPKAVTFVGHIDTSDEVCPPAKIYPSGVPMGWNLNSVNETVSNSTFDIDCNSKPSILSGYDDWSHLHYLLNSSIWEKLKFSNVGGAQERLPDGLSGERRSQSVIDHKVLLLSQVNDTATKIESDPVRQALSGSIGLSNNTTSTNIAVPNNASGILVVKNASGSYPIPNAKSVTIPTNSSTILVVKHASGNFAVQTGALANVTEAPIPLVNNTSTSSNVLVDNATGAIIGNGTGVIVTNAAGSSSLIENASHVIIPRNNTNGATVQNNTSLSDFALKSNDLSGAINKIDELSQNLDALSGSSNSTMGGVSISAPLVNSTIHAEMKSQLENLKLVFEKQLGS